MKKEMTPAEMGRKGGKRSVKSRFKGMTKKEISDAMRMVRRVRTDKDFTKRMAKGSVESLNKIKPE